MQEELYKKIKEIEALGYAVEIYDLKQGKQIVPRNNISGITKKFAIIKEFRRMAAEERCFISNLIHNISDEISEYDDSYKAGKLGDYV